MNREAMRHYIQHYINSTVPFYDFCYMRQRWNEMGQR